MSRGRGRRQEVTEADGPIGTEIPQFRPDCPCPKRGCDLHGRCTDCRQKHGRKGQAPRCER